MKSKLTLRLDERVKERAKRLAEQRGTSVSKIVEDYFRLLLREHADQYDEGSGKDTAGHAPDDLPPRTRQMLEELGPATETLDLDADTQAWVDAAHEKHK